VITSEAPSQTSNAEHRKVVVRVTGDDEVLSHLDERDVHVTTPVEPGERHGRTPAQPAQGERIAGMK
jgi:hypothetical protein